VTAYASPRRLAAHVTGVLAVAADKPVVQKLMPVAVGLDASGNATPALLKKLAALGADASAVAACAAKTTARPTSCSTTAWPRAPPGRGPAEGARGRAGRAADSQGDELPAAGRLEQRQLRAPGARLVALHGADVVPVSVLGLNSGNATRATASRPPSIRWSSPMPTATPRPCARRRRDRLLRRAPRRNRPPARRCRRQAGGKPIDDDALLDEVTALVERPNVLIGQFEPNSWPCRRNA
jgi:glycyl-tRNA synthetase beta chain